MSALRLLAAATAMALVAQSGCGGAKLQLTKVEGTLKMSGKPLDKIQVEFWPEGKGPRSIGLTDDQGRFALKTDDGKHNGAVVGTHRVVLHDTSVLGDKFLGRAAENVELGKGKKPRFSDRYGDPHKTTLKKEVAANAGAIDLEVAP